MDEAPTRACCPGAGANACAFAKAMLAATSRCALMTRRAYGEQLLVECTRPDARADCAALAALMRERARFALRLPGAGRPLMHQQALRLQCGGLEALREVLGVAERDAHRLVAAARERDASFAQLPWAPLVAAIAAWTPRRRTGR